MLCYIGRVALVCFLLTIGGFFFLFFNTRSWKLLENTTCLVVCPLIYFSIIWILIKTVYKTNYQNSYQVALRASLLGFILSTGIFVHFHAPENVKVFGWYMCVMAVFHFTEFLAMAIIQPKLVSVDSFVINHSLQYTVAAISSWVEFALETWLFPGLKTLFWLSTIGLIMCIFGDLLRKSAMLTAKSNFTHQVQFEKSDDHELVTHGVYSWCRHPSYVGWFYWSIGTQIILVNPICIIGYTVASWRFFKERITTEEILLLNFFGIQYCKYQKEVGTGIPFIEGYRYNI